MNIEYRDASYFRHAYGRGRVHCIEASCGALHATGRNKTEARQALERAIEEQLQHAYTRRYLRTDDVTFALYYSDGWGYDIVTGDGHRSSSTCMGGEITYEEALASMRRHFDQYIIGIEIARGMDRTNGELDAAILAYREDPDNDEKRERVLAAQQAHTDAFYAEERGEHQLATH